MKTNQKKYQATHIIYYKINYLNLLEFKKNKLKIDLHLT